MTNAVIVGTGSFAELADFYLGVDSDYNVVAFSVTNDRYTPGQVFRGRPIISFDSLADCFDPENTEVFVAVGYVKLNQTRQRLCAEVRKKGFRLLTYVSSRATVWEETTIGENVFVFEDNTVQPFTKIGDGVILWSGNHIGHHSVVEDWSFLSSHVVVSGHVVVGEHTFLGVNSTIVDSVCIGKRNLIGAGVVVQKGTSDDEVWLVDKAKKFPKPSSFFFK